MSTTILKRALGTSGHEVYPVGLGAMPLSLRGRPSAEDAVRVICAALDAGMELIDTADAYCLDDADVGHNERLIARALREWRGGREVVVATKGGVIRPGGEWGHDGRPEHLTRACEASLRALSTDCIELYQLHTPDEGVEFTDSVGALARLQEAGKIRHVGLSNVTVTQIREASRLVTVVSVQNRASPYHPQGLTDGVLAHCESESIAFLPYSPVGGWQAGKTAHEPVLQSVGNRRGVTPYQVVLAWLLAKSPAVIPIPGASRVSSGVDSAVAAAIMLRPEDHQELDRAYLSNEGDG
ncbi:MAG: aldo/keto reductase [bacterium]